MNALLFATTVFVWGTTWIAIAMQLGPVPVLTSIFYRFALAALLLLPVLALLGRLAPTRPRDHLFMALQGLCLFSLNFVCFYNATRFIPSGLVSVVFSLATIYNAVNARLFAPAVREGILGPDAPLGLALAALGTLFFSFGNMVSRRNSAAGVPPLTANAYGMTYASLALLAVLAATGTPLVAPPDTRYLLALGWLAVFGSVIGFTTYLMLVARIGSGRAAYATVMFPVIALLLSALYEGYVFDLRTAIGLGLTILGNLVIFGGLRWPGARASAAPPLPGRS